MRKFGQLRETHPLLGKAAYGHWYEQDMTGDYPGQQFCAIVAFDESKGICKRCGNREHRQRITDRMLVGCNAGQVRTHWSVRCMCGATSVWD